MTAAYGQPVTVDSGDLAWLLDSTRHEDGLDAVRARLETALHPPESRFAVPPGAVTVTPADQAAAEAGAAQLLAGLGMDCAGDLARTPSRMAAALGELTAGLVQPFDPERVLARTFAPPGQNPQMILARDIEFTSVCEHHVLPFAGTACIGYLPKPGKRIVGLSKLARVLQGYAASPQMQERLGEQVIAALAEHLDIQGAGCLITAVHTCLTLRGARAGTARMTTSHLSGAFLDAPVRGEFLSLARS